jgi:hypothetical protein
MVGSTTKPGGAAQGGILRNLYGATWGGGTPTLSAWMRKRAAAPHAPDEDAVYAAITREIERYMATKPRGIKKRLAAGAGLTPPAFAHRMIAYRGEKFSFGEIEGIRIEAGLPPGWPYLPLEDARALDAFVALLRVDSTKQAAPRSDPG